MKNKNNFFNREQFLAKLAQENIWDVIIIGGGATGLGAALDSAARGFKTLLLEQSDFAKGTSSRSTKLVHGGVRYLAQGDISLVYEALKERGRLLNNAPHIVKKQAFIIPCYDWFSELKYLVGLKLYDWMAARFRFGTSNYLGKEKVLQLLPGINGKGLKGGIEYYDGQFDDARLAVNLAQTCAEKGGVLLNYVQVKGLLKGPNGKIIGVTAYDLENNREYKLNSKSVINATGVFVDEILDMDTPARKPLVKPSQGVHLVLNKSFLNGQKALMIPKTPDGRVLFAVPWHDHILLGTTDTPLQNHSLEPVALEEEIEFILETVSKYLVPAPSRKDVLSVFAGLRPLAATDNDSDSTKEISRSHKIIVSESGLLTITGGKWTTYRKMAEDTIDRIIKVAGLNPVDCNTSNLKIHGFLNQNDENPLSIYGSDKIHITALVDVEPQLGDKLHERMPYIQAEVIWAVRNEMARNIEDVLARRLRVLFLDARAAIEMAPKVAALMAKELKLDLEWEKSQISNFETLASQYLLEPYSADKKIFDEPVIN
ncbi:glycerol-3-phosphate dehydrogenase/oxidase [Daejeonella oryzae]|uniref:glycerol-3-phosphate dehydrogenase/oxidase n=1 Tax=Daejeonella oryzae TaxID=1122943 RepID=UPI00047A8481